MQAATESEPKKARFNVIVSFLTVFFDYRGVVHGVFLEQGNTLNFVVVIRNLHEAITPRFMEEQKLSYAP